MKLGYLLVNLALVGGGILVYDLTRKDPAPPSTPAPVIAARDESPRPAEPPAEAPRLAGMGLEEAVRRIEELERRLRSVEGAPRAGVVADGASREPGSTTPSGTAEGDPPAYQVPTSAGFDARTVQEFRVLLEELERQRQEERRADAIRTQLGRLDLMLSTEQTQAVIRETLAYRERVSEAFRQASTSGATREQREASIEPIRADYENALRRQVPEAEVEKILDSLARGPGGRNGRYRDGLRAVGGGDGDR
jgi:hypothetical protein